MKNLLAVDVGNSNIVTGYYRGSNLVNQWRIHTDRKKMVDEYGGLFDSFMINSGIKPSDIDVVAISNVVPSMGHLLEKLVTDYFKKEAFFVGTHNKSSMKIKLDNPLEIGGDLIAAGVGAIEKYGSPCIVIDFGTATTISAIDGENCLLGGAIAPGLAVSCEALYTYAPHLPRITLQPPPSVVGSNTIHAMQAGIFTGYCHLIGGLVEDTRKILGADAKVIATGGLAEIFAKGSNILDQIDPQLVLDGIRILYEMNCQTIENPQLTSI